MSERIFLSEDLLIGKGTHKSTYIDPVDEKRCIKVPFTVPDIDLERELKYRESRKRRKLTSQLLPEYYGKVETNIGTGYVFERIKDFDGKTSLTIWDLFENALNDSNLVTFVEEVMLKCKSGLFEELIITSNMEATNFSVQRLSETEFRVRITDNIGSPVLIPLAYYFNFFARKRTIKYWAIFLNDLQKWYPTIMTKAMKEKLL